MMRSSHLWRAVVIALSLLLVLGTAFDGSRAAAMASMMAAPAKCHMPAHGDCDDGMGKMAKSACDALCATAVAALPEAPRQDGPTIASFLVAPSAKLASARTSPDPSPPRSCALI